MTFIPNWQLKGFKDKNESWNYVVNYLTKNRKKITSHSLSNEAVFTLGGQMFVIKGKKKEEKE